MNKRLEKERDERQRFSLRKLSVGLASVLVGVSFMAINAGQTVHADELQTPSQSNSAVQKADNATNDTVNANEQNQIKSDTAQTTNHADPNNNQQQNADKNTGATATNAIAKQKDNVTIENNEKTGATAKDDTNKVQENVSAPQNAVVDQKRQTMAAFAVEKANKPIAATMLNENKITDAQNSNSSVNKGVDPVKFAANGGFDPKIWGTMDTSKWQLDASGNITGYTGDMSHIIIPNSADFAKAGKNYQQIGISSDEMEKLGNGNNAKADTLAISLTDNKKVKATNADWNGTFSSTFLKQANLEGLDTSNITNMNSMFYYAKRLTSLDVSNWDTSNVTNMNSMFLHASSLTSLDVSNWDTSNVTNMNSMFFYASSLTSLDVSNWDTSNVTNMHTMFFNASSLKSLDVSKWNTGNVTSMNSMFFGNNKLTLIANNPSGWQHATDYSAFAGVPAVITNNANILNATDNGNYTVDGNPIARSVIFDSANSALQLPAYKGYANYTSDADRLKYTADVIKVYNGKLMKDYNKMHSDRTLNYADDQDMNDPVALARAKFVTVAKVEDIQDNQANHDKLHATATREYIIHNIDGSTTTITQSINYHRTGKHNMVTNEDTFTEWIYSPDKNSVVVVVTKDKNGKAIANPVTVEGDNCIERNGKAYFGSIKIKPKAGFKLAFDKPATAKLNTQAKLASRLLPRQFFVLKAFAPMSHKTTNPTKQVASANSIKPKQDHPSAPIEPITSTNAIKQGKDVIVKPVVKPIKPNEHANIHDQTHTSSLINAFANTESQLAISMANSKQSKPDFNNQGSMQIANLLAENSQKSAEAKLQHPVTRTNSKVKSAEIATKLADSHQNQNKKVLAEKTSAKPTSNISTKDEKASAKSVANISTKAEKTSVKSAVNIPAKTAQPAIEKTTAIAKKQTNTNHSLPQTSSVNNLGATVIGLIMSGLSIALAGIKKRE